VESIATKKASCGNVLKSRQVSHVSAFRGKIWGEVNLGERDPEERVRVTCGRDDRAASRAAAATKTL